MTPKKNTIVGTSIAFAALALALCGPVKANAAPQYVLQCNDCHNMPPLDTYDGSRDGDSGAVAGNHQSHLAANATGASCAPCHGGAVNGYSSGHRDGAIGLAANIGGGPGSPLTGSYPKGTSFQQSMTPTLGSCSSVNCHFETPTPNWGTNPATTTCSSCHGAAPNDGSHPVAGSKHAAYYGTGTGSCRYCHSDHLLDAAPFAHATSAGKRSLDVSFQVSPNSGGVYSNSANLAYPKYLPSQSGPRNGTCSNLYCHSQGTGSPAEPAAATVAPAWGATLDCSSCHGFARGSSHPLATNAHQSHIDNAAKVGRNLSCATCHAATTTDGTTIAQVANHVDGKINVKFDNNVNRDSDAPNYTGVATAPAAGAAKSAGGAAGDCTNVYCHSDGKGTYRTIAWNGAAIGCDGCHGNQAGKAHPVGGAGNSHVAHVESAGLSCSKCHLSSTLDGTVPPTAVKDGGTHLDRHIDVNFTSGSYDEGAKSCSNVYCHSNGAGAFTTPVWGNPASGACGSCHNTSATIAAGGAIIASNGHLAHLTGTYGPKLGQALNACTTCHSYAASTHANGSVNLVNGPGSACQQCHPNGLPTWSAGRISDCTSCHAATPSVIGGNAAPYKTNFTSSGHGKAGYTSSLLCSSCHDADSGHISGTPGSSARLKAEFGGDGSDNAGCAVCHNDAGKVTAVSKRNMASHVLDKTATPATSSCNACHEPHGTANLSMIRENFTVAGVSGAIAVDFKDPVAGYVDQVNNRGLCQVCHTQTNHYRRDIDEDAHPTENCLTCHDHKGSWAFKPSGACDACHGYPPAPKHSGSFGSLGQWANGRFEDYSGGGGAHLVAAHVSPNAVPADGWAPCAACHNEGISASAPYHTVSLPIKNNIAKVTLRLSQDLRLDPNKQAVYSSAQLSNLPGQNRTGSCMNVSCHFKRSPRWSKDR